MPTKIEEFNKACHERSIDAKYLHLNDRRTGHMHFGGISIECLIKFLVVKYYDIQEREGIYNWLANSNATGLRNNIVRNPSHSLVEGIKLIDFLFNQVDTHIRQLIDILQRPTGINYIELRYDAKNIADTDYDEWKIAYTAIRKWLVRNIKNL